MDDAWAYQYEPTLAHNDAQLRVKLDVTGGNRTRETYLKFDLDTVPSVGSALLRLIGYAQDSTTQITVAGHGSTGTTWTETTLTWNNRPAAGAVLDTQTVSTMIDQLYEWDVTSWVRDRKAAGDRYVTLVLKGTAATTPLAYFHSDEATDVTERPRLLVPPAAPANQPPVANDATFSVPENSANGTTVGTYAATDPDAGQTLAYAITAGNADGAFAINAGTGAITVADGTKLDYETATSRVLTVTATDNGSPALSDPASVTITVNDVADTMTGVALSDDTTAENSPIGYLVGVLSAQGVGAGPFTYSLLAGAGGEDNASFAIVDDELRVNGTLDHVARPTLNVRVQATDSGGATIAQNLVIRVTPPATIPLSPTSLTVTPTSGQIDLAWVDASTDEDGFLIERRVGTTGTFEVWYYFEPGTTSTTDLSVVPGEQYAYRITAFNAAGSSAASGQSSGVAVLTSPAGFYASADARDVISLGWQNTIDAAQVVVERSLSGGAFTRIATLSGGTSEYVDSETGRGTTARQYRVAAFQSGQVVGPYATTDVLPVNPLMAPTGLTVTGVTTDSISLAWTDSNADEEWFVIDMFIPSDPPQLVESFQVPAGASNYTATGLPQGHKYRFTVTANSEVSFSPRSGEVFGTSLLLATSNLALTQLGGGVIELTWQDNSGGAAHHIVDFGSDKPVFIGGPTSLISVPATGTFYRRRDAWEAGVTYSFRVTASSGYVRSAPSNWVSFTATTTTTGPAVPIDLYREANEVPEDGQSSPAFVLTRQNTSQSLTISFAMVGTARPGVDYVAPAGVTALNQPATVLFPAGQNTLRIPITGIADDEYDSPRAQFMLLGDGVGYYTTTTSTDSMLIADNEPKVTGLTWEKWEPDADGQTPASVPGEVWVPNADLVPDPQKNERLRIFPDKLAPFNRENNVERDLFHADRNKVLLKAQVGRPDVRVIFNVFDVDDIDNSSPSDPNNEQFKTGEDNRLTGDPNNFGEPTKVIQAVTDANGVATVTFSVTKQPGNNYRAFAFTDPGIEVSRAMADRRNMNLPPGVAMSKELVVWRKLHLERDSMRVPANLRLKPEDDDVPPAAREGRIIDVPVERLRPLYAKAFILVDEKELNAKWNPRRASAWRRNIEVTDDLRSDPANSVRDVFSEDDFWVVQVFTAYEPGLNYDNDPLPDPDFGTMPGNASRPGPLALQGDRSDRPVYIFREVIRDFAGELSDGKRVVGEETLSWRTVWHETLHRFNMLHENPRDLLNNPGDQDAMNYDLVFHDQDDRRMELNPKQRALIRAVSRPK